MNGTAHNIDPAEIEEALGITALVGFLGLCLIGEEITAKNRQGVEFVDPFVTAERYLPVLEEQGAEVIVAACTEIPLVLTPDMLPVPLVSSTDVLAEVTAARCAGVA